MTALPTGTLQPAFDQHVLRLVDQALDINDRERDQFIAQACGDDEALREAVHAQLRACELVLEDPDFLRGPAAEVVAPVIHQVEAESAAEAPLESVAAALRGRYEFLRELGRGGSAVVYLARDVRHDREVAIKLIQLGSGDRGQRSRFLREISVAAKLRHPYIVSLIDSGESEAAMFYVMPYIQGESLRQLLDRQGALSLPQTLSIVRDVAEALDYAHARGVVHRDIKPQNILLSSGHAHVADFGIALALETTLSDRSTDSSMVIGTPAYMSPEQATANSRIDARSDVYSLACTVYEMLASEVPYGGNTPRAVLAKHIHAPVPAASVVRPQLPTAVDEVLTIALAKLPADRFATAGAFAAAFAEAATMPSARSPNVSESLDQASSLRVLDAQVDTWFRRLVKQRLVRVTLVIGTAAAGLLLLQAIPPIVRAPPPLQPDTTVYAVFPMLWEGPAAEGVRDLSLLLHEAVRQWTGIRVLDPSALRDLTPAGAKWTVESAADRAHTIGAGRFLWGETTRTGDSLRLHLRLSDVRSRGLVIMDRVVHVGVLPSNADTLIARALNALLVRAIPPDPPALLTGSRSLPAQQSFSRAWRALFTWQLDSATRLLENAVQHDPQFGRAHLWLALVRSWSNADHARFQMAAQQANLHSQSLDVRERIMALAIAAESETDYGTACPQWVGLTRTDSTDFAAWYGAARCHQRDDVVRRDPMSPSGWAFRSSYHRAAIEYQRAFRLRPAILMSLRERSFEPLRRLLVAGGNYFRGGHALPPESGLFRARVALRHALSGDSLAFVPYPAEREYPWKVDAGAFDSAVVRQREVVRVVASNWVSTHLASADARQALAVTLAMLGDQSALDTLAAAKRLATTAVERLRLALSEAWMQLAFGVEGADARPLLRARTLADSLLAENAPETTEEPMQMAALAALVGRGNLAAKFARRSEVGREMGAPPSLLSISPALIVFAALGGPADSVAWLQDRANGVIMQMPSPERMRAQLEWIARSATLCFPYCAVERFAFLRGKGDSLLDLQLDFRSGKIERVRSSFRDLANARRGVPPELLSFDGIAPEAQLLHESGDTRAFVEWLGPTMEHALQIPPHTLATPVSTASLVRAMHLRSVAASQVGDTALASRWSRAVRVLRSNADAFLRVEPR